MKILLFIIAVHGDTDSERSEWVTDSEQSSTASNSYRNCSACSDHVKYRKSSPKVIGITSANRSTVNTRKPGHMSTKDLNCPQKIYVEIPNQRSNNGLNEWLILGNLQRAGHDNRNDYQNLISVEMQKAADQFNKAKLKQKEVDEERAELHAEREKMIKEKKDILHERELTERLKQSAECEMQKLYTEKMKILAESKLMEDKQSELDRLATDLQYQKIELLKFKETVNENESRIASEMMRLKEQNSKLENELLQLNKSVQKEKDSVIEALRIIKDRERTIEEEKQQLILERDKFRKSVDEVETLKKAVEDEKKHVSKYKLQIETETNEICEKIKNQYENDKILLEEAIKKQNLEIVQLKTKLESVQNYTAKVIEEARNIEYSCKLREKKLLEICNDNELHIKSEKTEYSDIAGDKTNFFVKNKEECTRNHIRDTAEAQIRMRKERDNTVEIEKDDHHSKNNIMITLIETDEDDAIKTASTGDEKQVCDLEKNLNVLNFDWYEHQYEELKSETNESSHGSNLNDVSRDLKSDGESEEHSHNETKFFLPENSIKFVAKCGTLTEEKSKSDEISSDVYNFTKKCADVNRNYSNTSVLSFPNKDTACQLNKEKNSSWEILDKKEVLNSSTENRKIPKKKQKSMKKLLEAVEAMEEYYKAATTSRKCKVMQGECGKMCLIKTVSVSEQEISNRNSEALVTETASKRSEKSFDNFIDNTEFENMMKSDERNENLLLSTEKVTKDISEQNKINSSVDVHEYNEWNDFLTRKCRTKSSVAKRLYSKNSCNSNQAKNWDDLKKCNSYVAVKPVFSNFSMNMKGHSKARHSQKTSNGCRIKKTFYIARTLSGTIEISKSKRYPKAPRDYVRSYVEGSSINDKPHGLHSKLTLLADSNNDKATTYGKLSNIKSGKRKVVKSMWVRYAQFSDDSKTLELMKLPEKLSLFNIKPEAIIMTLKR